jgi:hypothetical protein
MEARRLREAGEEEPGCACGGGTVALSTIQGELGIEGDVAAAASSDGTLVAVAQDGPGWTVASLRRR